MQADPGLVERDAGLLAEFEAAPWLLPPRTKALKYAGVHKLDELLQLRSVAIGNYPKTITLVTFNKRFAVMAQNTRERWCTAAAGMPCSGAVDHHLHPRLPRLPPPPLLAAACSRAPRLQLATSKQPSLPAVPPRLQSTRWSSLEGCGITSWPPGTLLTWRHALT